MEVFVFESKYNYNSNLVMGDVINIVRKSFLISSFRNDLRMTRLGISTLLPSDPLYYGLVRVYPYNPLIELFY